MLGATRKHWLTLLMVALGIACTDPGDPISSADDAGSDFDSPVRATGRFVERPLPLFTSEGPSGDIVLSFEGFPSATMLPETAYAAQGVHIVGAMIFNIPNYNWGWYPPHSGIGVVSAPLAGPGGDALLSIRFDSLWSRVAVFVTGRRPVTITCVTPSGRKVGEQTHLAPNLEDNGEWSLHPSNQEIAVEGDSISNCTLVGDRNGFSVDDLTLRKAAAASVSVTLSRSVIYPVFADSFSAVTQRTRSPLNPGNAMRRDTVSLHVRGLRQTDSVWVVSRPVDGSGGHLHPGLQGRRPRGTWYQTSQLADGVNNEAPNRPDSVLVPATQDSVLRIVYRSSGVTGIEWLVMRSATARRFADSAQLTVALDGMAQISRTGTNHWMEASTNHSGHDEYLHTGALAVLDSIWARWLQLHAANPALYPMAEYPGQGKKFNLSGTSLSIGGLLDITGSWTDRPGHISHREGVDADFNSANDLVEVPETSSDTTYKLMKAVCRRYTFVIAPADSFSVSCDAHGGTGRHFHVFLVPLNRRDTTLAWRAQ